MFLQSIALGNKPKHLNLLYFCWLKYSKISLPKIQFVRVAHGGHRFLSIWWVPFACRPLKYVLGLWGWLKSHRISFWAALGAVYKWLLVVFDGSWNLRAVKIYGSFSFLPPWDFPSWHPFSFTYFTIQEVTRYKDILIQRSMTRYDVLGAIRWPNDAHLCLLIMKSVNFI